MNNLNSQRLVAHRGWPMRYPENTLAGFSAAIACGARLLECDVQLTQDHVAVVFHDPNLERMTNARGDLRSRNVCELRDVVIKPTPNSEPPPQTLHIPKLEQLIETIAQNPQVHLFVEIKSESIEHFGRRMVVDEVLKACAACRSQITLISRDADCLVRIRKCSAHAIAWIPGGNDRETRTRACKLNPDILFISARYLSNAAPPPWPCAAKWGVYTLNDPAAIQARFEAGFDYVETDDVGTMIKQLQ